MTTVDGVDLVIILCSTIGAHSQDKLINKYYYILSISIPLIQKCVNKICFDHNSIISEDKCYNPISDIKYMPLLAT